MVEISDRYLAAALEVIKHAETYDDRKKFLGSLVIEAGEALSLGNTDKQRVALQNIFDVAREALGIG